MSGENLTPITRKEMFLAKAAGQDVETPEPITREEMFLSKINGSGGGGSGGGEEGDIGAEKYLEAQYAEVVLPNAKSLKPYVFYQDRVLTHIEMPKVTSIGNHTFNGCTNLAITSLPSGLSSIGVYAFNGCSSITAITFKGKPTIIERNVFNGCINLKTINVPWAEGEVDGAPWGATNATINYNYTGE